MKPTKPINLTVCLLACLAVSTGCQSGFLKKPDLGNLAFWKNENLRLASKSDDIPPPSKHFSPDPGSSDGSQTKEDMEANIDQIIANAKKKQMAPATDSGLAKTDIKNKAKTEPLTDANPIRKPYSLDSIDPKIGGSQTKSNDFVISDKIKQFQATTDNALAATEKTITKAASAVQSTTNTISGWKNTLQASSTNQIKQVTGELSSQANQAIASTANAFKQFSHSTTDSISQSASSVKGAIDNSFQPNGSSQVVTNPYSGKDAAANSISSSGKDFISKYKTASQQQTPDLPNGAVAVKNKTFSNNPLVPNNVKQSSFNGSVDKNAATLLQPAQEKSTGSQASPYPTTGFEAFSPSSRSETTVDKDVYKIPPSLLRGDSTFSPGSTRPLRPINSNSSK